MPDSSSNMGPQIFSVTPGYTVDSYTTTAPFFIYFPTIWDADSTGDKSGVLS